MYKHTNHWDQFKKGLEPADQEIVDRLQKLKNKEQNIPLPSVDEIKRRLALLKDQDPESNGNSNVMNVCELYILYIYSTSNIHQLLISDTSSRQQN